MQGNKKRLVFSTPLYNFLPTLYVLIGTLLVMTFDHWTRDISGVIFILSGTLVFNWRITARTTQKGVHHGR